LKAIRKRVCSLAIAVGLSVLASILVYFQAAMLWPLFIEGPLLLAIFVTMLLMGFLIREFRKLKTARLIMENIILYIQTAQIDASNHVENSIILSEGGLEVFISCFGILLDSKVIKFNLDGIYLKAVEIGGEFIYLTYGTDMQMQRMRILHGAIPNQELQDIVKRFRYETGIVPVIIDR